MIMLILLVVDIIRFYVGGSPFPQYLRFQLSSTQAYFNVDVMLFVMLNYKLTPSIQRCW